ncbi:MAG: GNAT family N-acetyltransferase [Gammaproteobacteria bacterium]|nr:GNAT family N-acetyltransferase [Gammaproteobacteria bacterium]
MTVFRYATPADIYDIVTMCAEHAAVEQSDYDLKGKSEKLSMHLFNEPKTVYCFVAESEAGDLLGYATFTKEFSTWDADYYINIDCLYIREDKRNSLLGWRFARKIVKEIVELGVDNVQCQTPPFNTPAIRLYEGLGGTKKEKCRFYWSINDLDKRRKQAHDRGSSERFLRGLL